MVQLQLWVKGRARSVQALVYHGPNQMHWEGWPDPQPGPGDALLEVLAVRVCGSDVRGDTGKGVAWGKRNASPGRIRRGVGPTIT